MTYLPHWPIPSSLGKREINYETVFERMSPVLERLGNPHKKLPPIIHVTGTNGKGSVIAFLAAILQASSLKTHIYTSPHLHHCNERIVLDGQKISDNFLYEVLEEARIAAGETPLTFFEAFTIASFLAFAKTPADVLIIEVGMGGRIDATNIIEEKLATIITPISFDHVEYLGNSIERIAVEKAHIIKPSVPAIIGPQPHQAQEIIEIIAQDQNAKMIRYDQEFSIIKSENNKFDFSFFEKTFFDLPAPALVGEHQYINASIAIACALTLPFQINQTHIEQGLARVSWPSRLEKITNNLTKIFKNQHDEIFLDGAHNQTGALTVARFIMDQKILDIEKNHKIKNFIICGFSKNKCKKEFLLNFVNLANKVVAVRVEGEPYPEDSQIIAKIGAQVGLEIEACADLQDALHYIQKNYGHENCRVIICGSLHLARDVKKFGDYCQ